MARKLEISISLAVLLIAILAWRFPVSTSASNEQATFKEPFYKSLLPAPSLTVSGTGAKVQILSNINATFTGGEVSETGSKSTIYIKPKQKIKLILSGTGAKVFIQDSLMPFVTIKNTATGGSVHAI